MEKNTTNFINEIKAEIEELKARIGALEGKLNEYEAHDVEAADFTDIELSVGDLPEELPVEEDLPEEIPPRAPLGRDDNPVIPSEASPVIPSEVEGSPAPEPEPRKPRKKAEPAPAKEAPSKPYAWMVDAPQGSVKNIRSAISLQDRALYINTLFKEDFVLYDNTISALNAMDNPQDAASYIQENFPEWNLRSDAVYCFMMAVRKKLG